MSEIPKDVKRQATQIFADADLIETVPEAVEIIARAIMAERERCAKVARDLEAMSIKFAEADRDLDIIVLNKIGASMARAIAEKIGRGN